MQNNKVLIIGITVVIALVVGYGIFLLYVSWPVYFGNVDKAGVFGDSFGVLTSLFSGIAIVLIFVTILLQKKELAIVKGQLNAQNTTLEKQNFESTFFQLLRLHNETTNSVEYKYEGQPSKGRKCFVSLFVEFTGDYGNLSRDGSDEKDMINQAYNSFYGRHKHEVSHYFRTIYAVVKFIESSGVENVELYVNLIRVQLSDRELLLLFYHSLGDDGKELKPLIEKYGLFESLPRVNLLRQEHKSLYADSAYNIRSVNVRN